MNMDSLIVYTIIACIFYGVIAWYVIPIAQDSNLLSTKLFTILYDFLERTLNTLRLGEIVYYLLASFTFDVN